MQEVQAGQEILTILTLALLAALISGGVFAWLATRRSMRGTQVAVGILLPIVAMLAVPSILGLLTGGKAAWDETLPWVVPIALALPFVWLRMQTQSGQNRKAASPSVSEHSTAATPRRPETPAPKKTQPATPAETAAKAPTIFISYRRDDSADVTGRLYDRLTASFGREHVYKDVDSIPLGVDFREHINTMVSECDVVLAVIGRRWLNATGSNNDRRLDDETDPVRLEIVAALNRGIPVVPVLVSGSNIPPADALPDDIRNLAYRNGTSVRPDPDFHKDVDRLIAGLRSG